MRYVYTRKGLGAVYGKLEPCAVCGAHGQTFVNGKGWVCGHHHNVKRFELYRGEDAADLPVIVPPEGGKVVLR